MILSNFNKFSWQIREINQICSSGYGQEVISPNQIMSRILFSRFISENKGSRFGPWNIWKYKTLSFPGRFNPGCLSCCHWKHRNNLIRELLNCAIHHIVSIIFGSVCNSWILSTIIFIVLLTLKDYRILSNFFKRYVFCCFIIFKMWKSEFWWTYSISLGRIHLTPH